ncbi:hypothetical protein CALVIDRAFT_50597 [Calocera viscosa TUFC12733]|uniref:Uncharacterized protein n=1 Tax=Calocera viscosa (strain TUFC12733) TaxID=1330018 RepID=A0A167NRU0_CALVF|nr:hypothetical protein CALVIDRAFT_50597 [Calocera viscosa TUFC12733]
MPTFSFFNGSKRKEKRSCSNASQTSSTTSSSGFSSRSATPDLRPPVFPRFVRRGSEPATPPSRPPGIVLYTPIGPSVTGGLSAPLLQSPRLARRGSDNVTTSPRRRVPSPLPISPPRALSPPLPPHPAVASSSSSQRYDTVRAASFKEPRQLYRAPERPRSRSLAIPPQTITPPTISFSAPARPRPPRPPRPDESDDALLAPSPRLLFVGTTAKLPQLDEVWAAFLEEAEEDLDTLSELPNMPPPRPVRPPPPAPPAVNVTMHAGDASISSPQRPTGLVRAFTEPPNRPVPCSFLQEPISLQGTSDLAHKPLTPPRTPAFPRYRVPSLSPLEALDVSLAMSRGITSTGSKSTLASGRLSDASSLSVMSLQDALAYSISLSEFPKPPGLDAVQEETRHRAEVEGDLVELPYLSHLPTPPISPPNLVSIGKTGTVRARASSPTFNQGRIAIPSFGTILDASKDLEEVIPVEDPESSSDESFAMSRFSPSSVDSSAHHRRAFERNDSFSSISSASDVVGDFSDDDADCESTGAYEDLTMHFTPRVPSRSPRSSSDFDESQSPRSSFEDDEPRSLKRTTIRPMPAPQVAVTKERMQMDLPAVPFSTNTDIGPVTPKMSTGRSPSLFHVGWSPAPGTVEYGYAV